MNARAHLSVLLYPQDYHGHLEVPVLVHILPHNAQLKTVQLALRWIELTTLIVPDDTVGIKEVFDLRWQGELRARYLGHLPNPL